MANTLNLGTDGNWGTKDGSLLGYNNENNNFKPLPFDFTRASSATRVNKQGLIETVASGVPRIDFTDANGALLLEPQRTNRIVNSEDGSTWSLSNLTLSSLSGGLNKEYYEITSLGDTSRFGVVSNSWVNLTAENYTASVFAKKGTTDEIILTPRASFSNQDTYSVFNLTNGTVVSNNAVTGSIESYSDGWYKCSITFTNSGGYTNFASFAFGFNFNSSITDTLFVASPQSEIGSYATSYIPTQGSVVTVLADACSNGGNDQVINSAEGVLYAEIAYLKDRGTSSPFKVERISISDGTDFNRIFISNTTTANQIQVFVRNATGISFNQTVTISDVTDFNKIGLKWKANDYALWINGVELATDTTYNYVPVGLDVLKFEGASGAYDFEGKTKDLQVFTTALTDAELIALTTI